MQVLATLRNQSPDTAVIVLTAYASLETAVEALRHGAHDYLFKPCKTVELRESVRSGLQKRRREVRKRDLLVQLEETLRTNLAEMRANEESYGHGPVLPAATGPGLIAQRLAEQGLAAQVSRSLLSVGDGDSERFLKRGNLIVDFTRHVITLEGCLLELSPMEFNLLAYLASEAPRVVSAQELVREVQGYKSETWEARETARYHVYHIRRKVKQATGCDDLIRNVRGLGYSLGL
jgi:DNA-binding response OmpR family regulator